MKSSTKKNKSNTSLQSSSSSGLTQPSTALCSLQDVLPIDILAPLPLDMHSVVFAKQPSNNAMTPALSNETRMDMLLSLEKAKLRSELSLMTSALNTMGDALLQYASAVAGSAAFPSLDDLWVPPNYAPMHDVMSFPPSPNDFAFYPAKNSSSARNVFRKQKLVASSSEASTKSAETRAIPDVEIDSARGESSVGVIQDEGHVSADPNDATSARKTAKQKKRKRKEAEAVNQEAISAPTSAKKLRTAEKTIGTLKQDASKPKDKSKDKQKKKIKEVAFATSATDSPVLAPTSPRIQTKKGASRHASAPTRTTNTDLTHPPRVYSLPAHLVRSAPNSARGQRSKSPQKVRSRKSSFVSPVKDSQESTKSSMSFVAIKGSRLQQLQDSQDSDVDELEDSQSH